MKVSSIRGVLTIGVVLGLCASAIGVVIEVPVTPAYLKQEPKSFSIRAESKPDGLVHFTITRPVSSERYVVAELTVRKDSDVVCQSSIPAYVRERSATYYVAIAPQYLPDSTFELSDRTFGGTISNPIPLPGGTDYLIHLKDFAPKTPR